jgi:hypothetical protein
VGKAPAEHVPNGTFHSVTRRSPLGKPTAGYRCRRPGSHRVNLGHTGRHEHLDCPISSRAGHRSGRRGDRSRATGSTAASALHGRSRRQDLDRTAPIRTVPGLRRRNPQVVPGARAESGLPQVAVMGYAPPSPGCFVTRTPLGCGHKSGRSRVTCAHRFRLPPERGLARTSL